MGGCEMGRQQKRCVAVSGRRLEELRQRVQPAGRGADTDDEELAPVMADLPGVLTRPLVQRVGGVLSRPSFAAAGFFVGFACLDVVLRFRGFLVAMAVQLAPKWNL